jgi:hypothetical protein
LPNAGGKAESGRKFSEFIAATPGKLMRSRGDSSEYTGGFVPKSMGKRSEKKQISGQTSKNSHPNVFFHSGPSLGLRSETYFDRVSVLIIQKSPTKTQDIWLRIFKEGGE